MKSELIKVLFLSQWYPHRNDPMLGLFVQKHAEAVSLYCQVKALYIQADENISDFEIDSRTQNNLSELIVYYPVRRQNIYSKLSNTINYYRAYRKGFPLTALTLILSMQISLPELHLWLIYLNCEQEFRTLLPNIGLDIFLNAILLKVHLENC